MTVYQNMAFGPGEHRHAKGRDREKVGDAAKLLRLDALLERKPTQLSADSASASPSGARSCASRRSSCSTSRCPNLDAELRVSMRSEITACIAVSARR